MSILKELLDIINNSSNIIIAVFSGLLWHTTIKESQIASAQNDILNRQLELAEQQERLWHQTNYPDLWITEFIKDKNEVLRGFRVAVFNKSDFGFIVKGIASSQSFKFDDEDYDKIIIVNRNIPAKGLEIEHTWTTVKAEPGRPVHGEIRKVQVDRDSWDIEYEIPNNTCDLNIECFIPILNKTVLVDIEIKNEGKRVTYCPTYTEKMHDTSPYI